MKRLVIGILGLFAFAAACSAREIWVVQFRTHFPDVTSSCQTAYYWQSHLMLSNTTNQPLTVSLLSVSNGVRRADARDLVVLPHHTVSLKGYAPGGPHWQPDVPETIAAIWVNKLEVPDGIVVADRGEIFLIEPIGGSPTPPCVSGATVRAGLPFRVVEQLTPAGIAQYHLGVDIGDAVIGAPRLDARINLGVFNASSEPANATVQVRCSSPSLLETGADPVLATIELAIPPNALVQQTVLPSSVGVSCEIAGPLIFNVIVTSSQPGFSYAAALSNQTLPRFPAFSPATN